jgi:hypothetical protein
MTLGVSRGYYPRMRRMLGVVPVLWLLACVSESSGAPTCQSLNAAAGAPCEHGAYCIDYTSITTETCGCSADASAEADADGNWICGPHP